MKSLFRLRTAMFSLPTARQKPVPESLFFPLMMCKLFVVHDFQFLSQITEKMQKAENIYENYKSFASLPGYSFTHISQW